MRRLLVTGATGFVGRQVLAAAAPWFDVHAVARSPGPAGAAHRHAADLLDPAAVAALCADVRPEVVLHLAWAVPPAAAYDDDRVHRTWADATDALMAAAARAGSLRRFVGAGSAAEYAWGGGRCHEARTPLEPATAYGRAKCDAGARIAARGLRTGVQTAWARIFWLYGPGEDERRLVGGLAAALAAGRPFATGPGTEARDYLHVADAARLLVALARADGTTGPVNVGSGTAITVADLAGLAADVAGRPDLLRIGARPSSPTAPLVVADVGRLRRALDAGPQVPMRTGLAEVLAAAGRPRARPTRAGP